MNAERKKRRIRAVRKSLVLACSLFTTIFVLASDQNGVRVESTDSVGPRVLEKQTEAAVVRDYLEAWHALSGAFERNRPDLLDAGFVGDAREKLAGTIQEQAQLGMQTRYRDSAHDLKLVFYSPEGLSIELLDTVDYEVQILDHDKVQTTQHIHARYVAVLTPTEVRWKVRVFQAEPE
jgi:hypothetical protein